MTHVTCNANWQGILGLGGMKIPATVLGPVIVNYGEDDMEYDLSEALVTYDGHELLEEDERYEEIIEALHDSEEFSRHLVETREDDRQAPGTSGVVVDLVRSLVGVHIRRWAPAGEAWRRPVELTDDGFKLTVPDEVCSFLGGVETDYNSRATLTDEKEAEFYGETRTPRILISEDDLEEERMQRVSFEPSQDHERHASILSLVRLRRNTVSVPEGFFEEQWNAYSEYLDVEPGDFHSLAEGMECEHYPALDTDKETLRNPFLYCCTGALGIGRDRGRRYLVASVGTGYPDQDSHWADWYWDEEDVLFEDAEDSEVAEWEVAEWYFRHASSNAYFAGWAKYWAWVAISGRDPANEHGWSDPCDSAEAAFSNAEGNLTYLFSEEIRSALNERGAFNDASFEWTGSRYRIVHNGTVVRVPLIDNNQ